MVQVSADSRPAARRSSAWNPKSCEANGVITLKITPHASKTDTRGWQVRMKNLETRWRNGEGKSVVTAGFGRYERMGGREGMRGMDVPTNTATETPVTPEPMRVGGAEGPRVAILLGTKDGAAYLGEQLQSYADQTHRNWILVVSDDRSRDATLEMIERFAKERPQRV